MGCYVKLFLNQYIEQMAEVVTLMICVGGERTWALCGIRRSSPSRHLPG